MAILRALLWPFERFNDLVHPVGRWISVVAIALMVLAILIQVFFRYVLNSALPWPDEAARFCMLWLTGLMAPIAYRRGGFVAIDTLPMALPRIPAALLALVLLTIAGVVLWVGMWIGLAEVTGFGGRFATASLWLPTPEGWYRVPRSWMMSSIFVGFVLLFIVNIELILRDLLILFGAQDLKPLAPADTTLLTE
ncbi:TRAP transporter small permease [Palleronia caenipelagi]|uniref:TRAP transporter small permease protein n=1 Tax=Palleronia caenipelagi TaxID=2489174 RepID=A0A547Q9H3_9RHOB|nr:TRAP transporter small permease subunit [Palleronia caenipelagi]TRD23036.1 TRAP transporter small permease [Palleronia caenipelagi]